MARVKVVLNLQGINEIMRSEGVARDLDYEALRIANAAGPGFEAERGRPHRWVARAYVCAVTYEAMLAEANDMALTRAVSR